MKDRLDDEEYVYKEEVDEGLVNSHSTAGAVEAVEAVEAV